MAHYAIIDVGSNSIKLVIYTEGKHNGLKKVENIKIQAHLNDYLRKGQLTETGIDKLVFTLLSFQSVLSMYSLQSLICVGTAVIRQAENREQILRKVYDQTGIKMRMMTGEEEAYYGYLSVINSSSIQNALIVDAGGGSTEVSLMKNREFQHTYSFPFGVRTILKLGVDEQMCSLQLRSYLVKQFSSVNWIQNAALPLFCIGGSAHQIARILKHKEKQIAHEYQIPSIQLLTLSEQLSQMKKEEIALIPGLSKKRAETIIPAVELFISLIEVAASPLWIHGRKGMREGLVLEQIYGGE